MKIANFALLASAIMLMAGCGGETKPTSTTPSEAVSETSSKTTTTAGTPSFSVASSEYPSWSTLMVAAKAGLINGNKGDKLGTLEKKWNVDVVLEVKDYDPCLAMFANGAVDAVCMTNMDSLNPALGRPCTAICPNTTSDGATKVIGVGYTSPEELKC